MNCERQFKQALSRHGLIRRGDGVVIAVSGGVDSMVLLDLLARARETFDLRLTIAHVNHGLRIPAADAEEGLVRQAAARRGIDIRTARWQKTGGNLQDQARRFRRDFFCRVAREVSARSIALAHHRDDQAETVLLNLLRGTGLKGLGGMGWRTRLEDTIDIIRPLLGTAKDAIEAYAAARRIAFAEDESNATDAYRRNELRHGLLPRMMAFNPALHESLASMAERLRDDEAALHTVAMDFCSTAMREQDGIIELPRTQLAGLAPAVARRVLMCAYERLAGSRAGLNADQIARMEQIIAGANDRGSYRLPGGRYFIRCRNRIRFAPRGRNE